MSEKCKKHLEAGGVQVQFKVQVQVQVQDQVSDPDILTLFKQY
jgi:hypothetical protein